MEIDLWPLVASLKPTKLRHMDDYSTYIGSLKTCEASTLLSSSVSLIYVGGFKHRERFSASGKTTSTCRMLTIIDKFGAGVES